MRSDDFSQGIFTVFTIFFEVFLDNRVVENVSRNKKRPSIFNNKLIKIDHYNRENTMTKIIATHTWNINKTFIGIFIDMPLGYIVYYYHSYD